MSNGTTGANACHKLICDLQRKCSACSGLWEGSRRGGDVCLEIDLYPNECRVRAQLLCLWLEVSGRVNLQTARRRIAHAMWIIPLCLFLEVYLYTQFYEVNKMKAFISFLLVVAGIGVPIYILEEKPPGFHAACAVSYQPAANGGIRMVRDLTLRTERQRRRRQRFGSRPPRPLASSCSRSRRPPRVCVRRSRAVARASNRFCPREARNCEPVKRLLEIQCRENSEKLASLKNHIVDNGVSQAGRCSSRATVERESAATSSTGSNRSAPNSRRNCSVTFRNS